MVNIVIYTIHYSLPNEDVEMVEIRIYLANALERQRPICLMRTSGTPLAAACVAAPMRAECGVMVRGSCKYDLTEPTKLL